MIALKSAFDNVMLGNLPAKNRLAMSATSHFYMMSMTGTFEQQYFDMYEELAKGGVGTIFVEIAEMIKNIDNPSLIAQHRRLTNMIHDESVNAILQIGLTDYYENNEYNTIEPTEMTTGQIEKLIDLFRETAVRAEKSGFDGVQIHAGHFLFLSRFISPVHNHRKDQYGGTLENRSRILIDILKEIKESAPTLHTSIKLNFNDMTNGGLHPEDGIQIAKMLVEAGIDSIEVTANMPSRTGIKAGENESYFYEYGKTLAEQVNVPVILVGGNRSVDNMNKLLNDSNIEFFSLSRPLIREPDLINRWQIGDITPAACVSCNRCYRTENSRCIFNLRKQQ